MTRRIMEEKYEKMMRILETWLNQNGIPKSDQIKYYQKLIAVLETKKDDLENIVISSITASSSIGFGMGMIIGSFDTPNLPLSACFILFGILVAIPKKHKNDYLKDYEDIEEKRELIKKWWQEKNN